MLVAVMILVQLLYCKLSETSELWAKTDGRVKFYASGRTAAERSPGVLGISMKTRKNFIFGKESSMMIGKTILPLECVTIFGIFRLGRSPIFPISDSFPPSALSSDAVLRGSVGRLRQPQHPHHVRHVPGADLQADRLQQGPLPKGDNPVS